VLGIAIVVKRRLLGQGGNPWLGPIHVSHWRTTRKGMETHRILHGTDTVRGTSEIDLIMQLAIIIPLLSSEIESEVR
jgi:hypothetical protein